MGNGSAGPGGRREAGEQAARRAEVLVVSDLRLYREGLAGVLSRAAGIGRVATADGRQEALARTAGWEGWVALVDLSMGDAVRVCRELAARAGAHVVALGVGVHDDAEIIACAEAGVAGYVARECGLDELLRTIQAVGRDEAACSPAIAAVLLRRVASVARAPDAAANGGAANGLTRREGEILALIEAGLSNKEIARALCIETATVKNHVHHILGKLGASRRADAVAIARERDVHQAQV